MSALTDYSILWRWVMAFLLMVGFGTRQRSAYGQPPAEPTPKGAQSDIRLRLTSIAFSDGQPIPKKYTDDGQNISPPLRWSSPPKGTRELVLICDDQDSSGRTPWVHWVVYNLPPDIRGLPADLPKWSVIKNISGVRQGLNSWSSGQTIGGIKTAGPFGYLGPSPPPGPVVHRYRFKLYALDVPTKLPPGVDKNRLLKAMDGHVLARGDLVGTYQRKL